MIDGDTVDGGGANPNPTPTPTPTPTPSGGGSSAPETDSWVSPNSDPNKDWSRDRKHFYIFGWTEWARVFLGAHLFSDLPSAWCFLRIRNGNTYTAKSFKWFSRWLAEIGGWAATVINLSVAVVLLAKGIEETNATEADTYTYTTCTSTGYGW